MKIVYVYNEKNNVYVGEYVCQLDPIRSQKEQKEIYLIPPSATEIKPPDYNDEKENAIWCDGEWVIREKERLSGLTIEDLKNSKIYESKFLLQNYLLNNPLQWVDGEYYSITQEKQNQLTSKIMAATMAQTLSQPYTLTWNSTGDVCKSWTLQNLSALAFAIDEKVTKLVTYQQQKEIEINNCQTIEELNNIIIDYGSVQ